MRENTTQDNLDIGGKLTSNGLQVIVREKPYQIEYPSVVWQQTPLSVREALLENLVFGSTHFLPLTLKIPKANYHLPAPLLESFLFQNTFYDLLSCEKADGANHLVYLRDFYNLDLTFTSSTSTLPKGEEIPKFPTKVLKAVLPFTFGKESLTTLGLCRELGIEPILVYCQEPAHPHEETYKVNRLPEFGKKFGVKTYFIRNEPGLFRYGKAFNLPKATEIGWGTHTTMLALLMIPFVYYHQANLILMGNEYSNNEYELKNDWRVYLSYDQTSQWTIKQSNMVRLLTNDQCSVKSTLEPLDEINIFFILHHRYPHLGQFQFSCSGQHPLYQNSQWCHRCYKCARMYLFALAANIDPASLGFKEDILQKPGIFDHYFGSVVETGSKVELDFAFWLVSKRNYPSPFVERFRKEKLPHLKEWWWYEDHFTSIKEADNLPRQFQNKLIKIFQQEMEVFKKRISV